MTHLIYYYRYRTCSIFLKAIQLALTLHLGLLYINYMITIDKTKANGTKLIKSNKSKRNLNTICS